MTSSSGSSGSAGSYGEHDTERWVSEPAKGSGRTPFQRDRARVLHSAALRRLAAKTQVVRAGSGDFPRTRLTHSLECAQIGRELGASLGCDPDLVDAACLAHDMGHPPFGHNGETALAALASPGGGLECGGFEGNAQSLRLLTRLEPKVPGAGLNLTRATLDASLKYPWVGPSGPSGAGSGSGSGTGKYGAYAADASVFSWIRDGSPDGRRCLEAQVMDWADDIAYSVHDVEDGLHAGLIPLEALSSAGERSALASLALSSYCSPSWGATVGELESVFVSFLALPCWQFSFDGGFTALAAVKNLTSELVGRLCAAAEHATLAAARVLASAASAGDSAGDGVAASSTAGDSLRLTRYTADLVVPRRQLLECALLKTVALHYVMHREGAAAQQAGERELIAELAMSVYSEAPATLDPVLRPWWDAASSDVDRHRVIIDQLASLTDRSAVIWHHRLCS